MKPIVFKGKCTDPSYKYEHLYMKEVEGYGITQCVYDGDLVEMKLTMSFDQKVIIDPKTLEIVIEKDYIQNRGDIGNDKIGGLVGQ